MKSELPCGQNPFHVDLKLKYEKQNFTAFWRKDLVERQGLGEGFLKTQTMKEIGEFVYIKITSNLN